MAPGRSQVAAPPSHAAACRHHELREVPVSDQAIRAGSVPAKTRAAVQLLAESPVPDIGRQGGRHG
jgi:hypothetical protein